MTFTIRTRELTKRFGVVTAVQDLDLDVERGEVFGFLGPNGAGKTTTIRMLLDIVRPTSGWIELLGVTPRDEGVRSRIGFLPAELHLDRRYSVREVIEFLGALRGGIDQAEVESLFARFDLDPGRRIDDLSTGNRRKVGVVQAFASRSELLILDEPTSGLDPLLQHELLSMIEERSAAGTTIFMSSHVLPEVERVAARVAVLREGRLVSVGTVGDLRSRARHSIELHLSGRVEASFFDRVPGVVAVTADGPIVTVTVEGSMDAVIKRAAELTVERVVTSQTDLEDAFLELYR